ncbi:hypothetical protein Tco_0533361 [Tanacetum coccineum]
MGLISASSACASFPDLLLVSYSFDSVPMLSVLPKLASTAFPKSATDNATGAPTGQCYGAPHASLNSTPPPHASVSHLPQITSS